jgi:hypothetical protein
VTLQDCWGRATTDRQDPGRATIYQIKTFLAMKSTSQHVIYDLRGRIRVVNFIARKILI